MAPLHNNVTKLFGTGFSQHSGNILTLLIDAGHFAVELAVKNSAPMSEVVTGMVYERLLLPDSQEKGWLLDGYPRSSSQANALKEYGFQPDLFILLENFTGFSAVVNLASMRDVRKNLSIDIDKINPLVYEN
ncbi:ATP:AMP phosphotransferase [Forsythia ovata]|uniref:ATP:AMP phosphotransferase n=1 Tax=Forsythia ovata TaxID=205694 RepID=A0ABD1RIJ1_9LAMI